MKSKMINNVILKGRVYDIKLVNKVAGPNANKPGANFISGDLEIATDEEGLNIVPFHMTYCTEKTKKGAVNNTYTVLNTIITQGKSWVKSGKEEAPIVQIDSSLGLNDFFTDDDEHISAKRVDGGFIKFIRATDLDEDEKERSKFVLDMVINRAVEIEANEETGTPESARIYGNVFNFKNDILPVDFVVEDPSGVKYFLDIDPSNEAPLFTNVWGSIISRAGTKTVITQSAFGESLVTKIPTSKKKWEVAGSESEPYEFGEENTITFEDLKTAAENREVYLADIKKKRDEYNAQRDAVAATPSGDFTPTNMNPPTGEFKF